MRVDHEPSSRAGAFPAGACAVHVQYQGYSRAGALYPAACTAWLGGSARDARGLLTTAYGPLAGPSSTNPHYARVRRHARQKSSGRSGPGATALEPETVPPARLRLQSAPPARSVSGPWRAGQTLAWIDAPPARVLAPRQWLAPPTPPPQSASLSTVLYAVSPRSLDHQKPSSLQYTCTGINSRSPYSISPYSTTVSTPSWAFRLK